MRSPVAHGPGRSSALLQPESKHKAKKDSSVSRNKLDHTSSPHVHQRSSFSACEGGSWGTTETEGGWAAVWWGREAAWPLQASLDTLGLMEGPRQATVWVTA